MHTEEQQFCTNIRFGRQDDEQQDLISLYGCEDDGPCSPEIVAQRLPYTNFISIARATVNEAPFYNRGIDLSLNYSKQLAGGAFINARVLATRFLEQNVFLNEDLGRKDIAGQTGSNGLVRRSGAFGVKHSPTPRISGNIFMSYNKNAFTVAALVRNIGSGRLNVQDGWIGPGESVT